MDWEYAKTTAWHLLISMLAVAAMAILQSLIDLLRINHPEVIAAGTQTAAAFTAIKLLGSK